MAGSARTGTMGRGRLLFLVVGMTMAGTALTLVTKYADTVTAVGVAGVPPHLFRHPVFQTFQMFVGETLCMLVFRLHLRFSKRDAVSGKSVEDTALPFPTHIFAVPALCDMLSAGMMLAGLNFTYVSTVQMLGGSTVFFTLVLSVVFLRRHIAAFQWSAVCLNLLGTVVVGLASVLGPTHPVQAPNPLLGAVLVISGLFLAAVQGVLEEKFVGQYKVPALQAVGWEGVWGLGMIIVVMAIGYYIPVASQPTGRAADFIDASLMISNNWRLALAVAADILLVSTFMTFIMTVTKHLSASHRVVLNALRPGLVWAFSLAFRWQPFSWLQLGGFVVLTIGTLMYYEVFRLGCFSYEAPAPDAPASPLLVRKTPPTADDKQWLLDDVTGDPERA